MDFTHDQCFQILISIYCIKIGWLILFVQEMNELRDMLTVYWSDLITAMAANTSVFSLLAPVTRSTPGPQTCVGRPSAPSDRQVSHDTPARWRRLRSPWPCAASRIGGAYGLTARS